MNITKIRRITSAGILIAPECSLIIEDIELDGNALGTQLISCGQPVYIYATRTKISRHTDIGLWLGDTLKGFSVNQCFFDDPRGTQDQMAFTCVEFGMVTNCHFDRTGASATKTGSTLTSGGGEHIVITGNSIRRNPTDENDGYGISIEAFDVNYKNITISDNVMTKARIRISDAAVDAETFRQITITGNTLDGHEIGIVGRTTSYTSTVRNVIIADNVINNPYDAGIRLNYIGGQVMVSNNIIVDSNRGGLSNASNDHGLIMVYEAVDVSIQNNKLYMTSAAVTAHANASPYGLRLDATDRVTAKGNTFYNTTANPSYVIAGTNTNREFQNNTGVNDDVTTIRQVDFGAKLLRIHGNDGGGITLINAEGTGPNQDFHVMPDYVAQGGRTGVGFFFGYSSEFSQYGWWSDWSGSNKEYLHIDAGANDIRFQCPVFIGDNLRLKLNETGLTAAREFTFPDIAGKVAVVGGPDIAQNPLNKRWGTVQPGHGTAVGTVGVMDGLCQQFTATGAGSNTTSFDTTEGKIINYQTANSSGVVAGLLSNAAGGGLGRRLFGGRMICRFKLDSTTSARFYFGLTSATSLPISDTVLANGDSGIIVGFAAADTNYQIRTNDGSGPATVTAMTGTIAKTNATAFHTIEILWTASGNYIVSYDGTAQTISSDLPATTTDLYPNLMVQTSAAVQRTFTLKGLFIEADK